MRADARGPVGGVQEQWRSPLLDEALEDDLPLLRCRGFDGLEMRLIDDEPPDV